MSLQNAAPGVYVHDKIPLERVYQSEDLSTIGLFGQATLKGDREPFLVTSTAEYIDKLGGERLLIDLIKGCAIDWSNQAEPTIGDESRKGVLKVLGRVNSAISPPNHDVPAYPRVQGRPMVYEPVQPAGHVYAPPVSQEITALKSLQVATATDLATALKKVEEIRKLCPDGFPWPAATELVRVLKEAFTVPAGGAAAGGAAVPPSVLEVLARMAITYHAVAGNFANGGRQMLVLDCVNEAAVVTHLQDDKVQAELEARGVGLLAAPGMQATAQTAIRDYCGSREGDPLGDRFCFGVLDAKKDTGDSHVGVGSAYREMSVASYWPWLEVGQATDPLGNPLRDDYDRELPRTAIVMPPSIAVAGLFARMDNQVGAHRSPAGTLYPLNYVACPEKFLSDIQAGKLNGNHVNCIRATPREPAALVMGGRTLCNNSLYRYINVVRQLMVIRKTLKKQTRWAVFENSGADLDQAIYRTFYTYLEGMRRNKQIKGQKPEQAFRITNETTEADRANGLLKLRVEVALFRPAEFIVIDLTQKTDEIMAA